MKKIFFLITIISLGIIVSCTGVKSSYSSLEDESYLEFIGDSNNYKGNIYVDIDNNISFIAKVNNANVRRPKGNIYAISTGVHVITVTYGNKIIVKKKIYISSNETKKIVLP